MSTSSHENAASTPIGVAQTSVGIRGKVRLAFSQFIWTRVAMTLIVVAAILISCWQAYRLQYGLAPAIFATDDLAISLERAFAEQQLWAVSGNTANLVRHQALWETEVQPNAVILEAVVNEASFSQIRQGLKELEQAQVALQEMPQTGRLEALQAVEGIEGSVLAQIASLREQQQADMLQGLDNLSSLSLTAVLLIVLIAVLTLALGWHLVRQLKLVLVEPVEMIVDGANRLAAGELREDLPVIDVDELGQIAKAINKLRVSLALAEMKYRSLFAHTSNNMLLLDPETHRIFDVNRSFEAMTGFKRRELLNKPLWDLFEPEQKEVLAKALLDTRRTTHGLAPALPITTGARMLVVDVSFSLIEASTERALEATFNDVTEQQAKTKELSDFAFKDELSGLFNHRSFYQRLNEEIAKAHAQQGTLMLLFVDLDNFKRCNDTHGHQVGDQLLQRVGRIITEHTRQDRDIGFRYGGDEFAVILTEAPLQVGQRIAEQVRLSFAQDEQYGTTMSIGVALLKEGMDAEMFVRAADEALYSAKAVGKNAVHVSP